MKRLLTLLAVIFSIVWFFSAQKTEDLPAGVDELGDTDEVRKSEEVDKPKVRPKLEVVSRPAPTPASEPRLREVRNAGAEPVASGQGLVGLQPIQSVVHPPGSFREFDSEIQSNLDRWLNAGGGFRPPNYPDFDAAFLERAGRYYKTYSELPFRDGVYAGQLEDLQKQKHPFWIKMTVNQKTPIEFVPIWIHQKEGDPAYIDLQEYRSPYYGKERYFGVLSLPSKVMEPVFPAHHTCQDFAILPHYDWSENRTYVETFNARGYCRKPSGMTFVGKAVFSFVRP